MIASASAIIRSINSLQVGMSWISPATIPQLQAPASISPSCKTRRFPAPPANVLDRRGSAFFALDSEDFLDGRICQHPLGIAQRPHDQARLQFIRRNQCLLDVVVRRRLLRGDEARAHVDAVGTATRGRRIMLGMSSSPGWPPHSNPSTLIASQPIRSAVSE